MAGNSGGYEIGPPAPSAPEGGQGVRQERAAWHRHHCLECGAAWWVPGPESRCGCIDGDDVCPRCGVDLVDEIAALAAGVKLEREAPAARPPETGARWQS